MANTNQLLIGRGEQNTIHRVRMADAIDVRARQKEPPHGWATLNVGAPRCLPEPCLPNR